MNNEQLYLAVGLPCFLGLVNFVVILTGTLLARQDVHRLSERIEKRMDRLESAIDAGFNRVNDHLISINRTLGEHEVKLLNSEGK